MKKTIAHLHVWDKKNKGDHGIVLAVAELLRDRLPGCEIIDVPVDVLKSPDEESLRKINAADAVVVGGGGIYYRWFLPFSEDFIKKIQPPIVLFGVGYIREIGSDALGEKECSSMAMINNTAALSSVRDYYTKSFLEKLGVPAQKIEVIGDPVVFLKEESTAFMASTRPKIGININYSGWLGFGTYRREILSSYKAVAEYFLHVYNAEIYYLVHHPDEKIIAKELNIQELHYIDLPAREQKYAYRQLDLVIGMMLHSVVMAFGATTPEINVGYDIRNKSFSEFIGFPELHISADSLREGVLLERAKMVFEKRGDYRKKFEARKKEIWEKHDVYLEKIKALIERV